MKRLAGLLALAAIAALPSTAMAAQEAPVSLTGEVLYGADNTQTNPVGAAQCTTDGAGHTTYVLDMDDGFAIGPYPGTFDETVTVTIDRNNSFGPQPFPPFDLPGPLPDPPIPGSIDAGLNFQQFALVSVQAVFHIDAAGGTTIDGTKTLSALVPGLPNSGACADFTVGNVKGFYKDIRVSDLEYEARIHTASGTFVDEGNAVLTAREGIAQDQTNGNLFFKFDDFLETFESSLGTPVELKPGLGCGDLNHVHERANECKNQL